MQKRTEFTVTILVCIFEPPESYCSQEQPYGGSLQRISQIEEERDRDFNSM
jgi:hypothetical protein